MIFWGPFYSDFRLKIDILPILVTADGSRQSASSLSKMNSVFVILFAMFNVACIGTNVAYHKAYNYITVFFIVSILRPGNGTTSVYHLTAVSQCVLGVENMHHISSHAIKPLTLTPEVGDTVINPDAYPAIPVGRLVNYSWI